MVVLGAGRFPMSEVPLQETGTKQVCSAERRRGWESDLDERLRDVMHPGVPDVVERRRAPLRATTRESQTLRQSQSMPLAGCDRKEQSDSLDHARELDSCEGRALRAWPPV